MAKMHKAITVIQLKLEGQLIRSHPEWNMDDRDIFGKVDFTDCTVRINGKTYRLTDTSFPTVDPKAPLALSDAENELMMVLTNSFTHSERLNAHVGFLYSNGSMYVTKIANFNRNLTCVGRFLSSAGQRKGGGCGLSVVSVVRLGLSALRQG